MIRRPEWRLHHAHWPRPLCDQTVADSPIGIWTAWGSPGYLVIATEWMSSGCFLGRYRLPFCKGSSPAPIPWTSINKSYPKSALLAPWRHPNRKRLDAPDQQGLRRGSDLGSMGSALNNLNSASEETFTRLSQGLIRPVGLRLAIYLHRSVSTSTSTFTESPRLLLAHHKMARLDKLIPSLFKGEWQCRRFDERDGVTYQSHVARAPTSDVPLSRFLKTRSTDKQFAKRVTDVVFSKDSLVAAKLLLYHDAQKLVNKLDKVRLLPPPAYNLLITLPRLSMSPP